MTKTEKVALETPAETRGHRQSAADGEKGLLINDGGQGVIECCWSSPQVGGGALLKRREKKVDKGQKKVPAN